MKAKLLFLYLLCSISLYSQTNLVTNGNLENWTNPTTLENWTIENDVSQNTTDVAEGASSASLVIDASSQSPEISTLVPLESGITYTVSYRFKYVTTSFTGTRSVCIRLRRSGSATTLTSCATPNDNLWNLRETSFTPDQTGDYDLSLSTSNFFGSNTFEVLVDDIQVFDPTSLSVTDFETNSDIKVYPTVSEDIINFEYSGLSENYKISIFDSNGREYYIKAQEHFIDISSLSSGMYFMNFSNGIQNITKKIIRK